MTFSGPGQEEYTTPEIRVVNEKTGGEKGRKEERLELIPVEPKDELARVYNFGCKKYDVNNYLKGYDWSLSIGALLRHISAWQNGEDKDPESGLHHLAHASWHCFALQMFQLYELGDDDRIGTWLRENAQSTQS